MSGASQAGAALQGAAENAYREVYRAGSHLARAKGDVSTASDVVEVMSRLIDLVIAAEALHDAAENACKDLRAALSGQMFETGAASIHGTYHTAYLSKRPAFVSIDDEAAIPAEFVVQKPSIDKRAIGAAIKDGKPVAGASLLTPNEPVLVLRARKEAA